MPKPVTLPWWLAALALVGAGAGVIVLAVSRAAPVAEAKDPPAARVRTAVRDALTGRLTREDGTPVPLESGPGSAGEPLRVHFVPSADRAQQENAIEGLLTFLRRRAGLAVEGALLQSYGLVVESLLAGRTDIAFLTAASYARARLASHHNSDPDDDAQAFLQVVRHGNDAYPGSAMAYRAAFLVHTDSPLESLEDITRDTRVAMGAPTSGASSLLPSAMLNRLGKTPRITRYLQGYGTIITAVVQRAVDVGCIWWSAPNEDNPHNDARITVVQALPDVFEKTRILAFTGWISNEPVVARATVPPAVRRLVARTLQLYVATKTLTEAGRKELEAIGSIVGYIEATDEDFDPLMEIIRDAFANDPEGWADFKRSRR